MFNPSFRSSQCSCFLFCSANNLGSPLDPMHLPEELQYISRLSVEWSHAIVIHKLIIYIIYHQILYTYHYKDPKLLPSREEAHLYVTNTIDEIYISIFIPRCWTSTSKAGDPEWSYKTENTMNVSGPVWFLCSSTYVGMVRYVYRLQEIYETACEAKHHPTQQLRASSVFYASS